MKHVKDKNWEKVEHFHRAGSSCSEDYGVRGVPHVVLIDTEGKIAFVGHPASIDLEKGIEKLLKGEKLNSNSEDEEESGEDYSEKDIPKILEEMTSWNTKIKESLSGNDDLKKKTAGMPRDFVVLIRQTKLDGGKLLTSYENINVLVGP